MDSITYGIYLVDNVVWIYIRILVRHFVYIAHLLKFYLTFNEFQQVFFIDICLGRKNSTCYLDIIQEHLFLLLVSNQFCNEWYPVNAKTVNPVKDFNISTIIEQMVCGLEFLIPVVESNRISIVVANKFFHYSRIFVGYLCPLVFIHIVEHPNLIRVECSRGWFKIIV